MKQFRIDNSLHPNPAWWPPTSLLDFCEENYQISRYIAEFYNATTNALFVLLSIFGIIWVKKLRDVEFRFLLSFALLGIVGLGSFLFHSTLQWHTQLLDELPMVYGLSVFLFATLHMARPGVHALKTPWKNVSFPLPKNPKRTAGILVAYSLLFTASYLVLRNPVWHEVNFGVQIFLVTVLGSLFCFRLRNTHYGPFLSRKFLFGAASFLLGFLLWNIDNIFCDDLLRPLRKAWPQIAPLFEFHALWHILTGLGTYTISTCCVFMRLMVSKPDRRDVELRSILFGLVLYVAIVSPQKLQVSNDTSLKRTLSEHVLSSKPLSLKMVKSVAKF